MIEWIRSADRYVLGACAVLALLVAYLLVRVVVGRRARRHDAGSAVRRLRQDGAKAAVCPRCRGAGRLRQHRICPHCHGLGYMHDMSDGEIFDR